MRETEFYGTASEAPEHKKAWWRSDAIEGAIFWTFIAGLAGTPFWYGSNVLIAWGVSAVLFPGLAMIYEVALLIRGESHPVGIKALRIPAALFAAVVIWIVVQNATWTPPSWHHPIWGMAADALEKPIEGSISVNRDLTTLALVRLITAASVFWVAVQLCRNASRASRFIKAIVAISCGYAAYGLVTFALSQLENPSSRIFVISTFVNHNHYATYAGIGLVAVCGLILRLYQTEVTIGGGSLQYRIATFIEATGQKATVLLGSAVLILIALLLTGSRGGIIATVLGLFVLGTLALGSRKRGIAEHRATIVLGAILVTAAFLSFGDLFFGKIKEAGLYDENRMAVYVITLRSIFDAPCSGTDTALSSTFFRCTATGPSAYLAHGNRPIIPIWRYFRDWAWSLAQCLSPAWSCLS